jgi:hypothetical protein
MSRRSPGRATRQILSGAELSPPGNTAGGQRTDVEPVSFAFIYLCALAALVIAAALAWAIWGMGPASVLLLLLALGLIASWLVV